GPGGVVLAKEEARFAAGCLQPVIAFFARFVELCENSVPDRGGDCVCLLISGEQGEGGGVDSWKGIAGQIERSVVVIEGLPEQDTTVCLVGGLGGLVFADPSGKAEGVAVDCGRQVGSLEQFLDAPLGAGGNANSGQGQGTAVEQFEIVGIGGAVQVAGRHF